MPGAFICCTHFLLLEMPVCIQTCLRASLICQCFSLTMFLVRASMYSCFSWFAFFFMFNRTRCYPCTVLPYFPFFLCVSHLQPQWTSDGSGIVFVGWENGPRKLGIMYCTNRRLALTSHTGMLAWMQYWRMSTILICHEIRHDRIIINEPLLNHLCVFVHKFFKVFLLFVISGQISCWALCMLVLQTIVSKVSTKQNSLFCLPIHSHTRTCTHAHTHVHAHDHTQPSLRSAIYLHVFATGKTGELCRGSHGTQSHTVGQ